MIELSPKEKEVLNNIMKETEKLNEELKTVEKENVWLKYKDRSNDEETLQEKAKVLSPFLLGTSVGIIDSLIDFLKESPRHSEKPISEPEIEKERKEWESIGSFLHLSERELLKYKDHEKHPEKAFSEIERKKNELLWELIGFFLHLSERESLKYLDAKQTELFIQKLLVSTASSIRKGLQKYGRHPGNEGRYLIQKYISAKEYFNFKRLLPEEPGETFSDSLFWEFGGKMTKILIGVEHDIVVRFSAVVFLAKGLKSLQLSNLLREGSSGKG